jgi:hypothetical protein
MEELNWYARVYFERVKWAISVVPFFLEQSWNWLIYASCILWPTSHISLVYIEYPKVCLSKDPEHIKDYRLSMPKIHTALAQDPD